LPGVAFAAPGKKIFIPLTETLHRRLSVNESLTIENHRKPRELGGFVTMATGPAVNTSIGANGIERPVTAAEKPRRRLTRQESILLRIALATAVLAAIISIVARLAGEWPTLAPIIAIALFIFGVGSIVGAAMMALSVAPLENTIDDAISTQLTDVIDASPLGIAIWDARGRLSIANSSYSEFLELAAPDVIIGSARDSIRAIGGRALESVLATGTIISPRGRFIAERGELADGGTIEIIADVSDIAAAPDAAKETETRLRHLMGEVSRLSILNDDLQGEVMALESRIAEERSRAEAAVSAKSDFLSHMSHELRTPLNAIIGFTDMMQSGIFGPLGHEKYGEYVSDIHASGQQLLDKITDILDVSQIQSGDIPIERQRINLEDEIAGCLSMLRPRIFASGIALTEIIDDLPTVYADPMAVRQILLHILSNAMKFTPTGGRISLRAKVNDEDVTIVIDDTGIGITPEIMEKIDQPFSALERDALISGDEGAGLGVGLSVSRALARLNGGALSIESEEGFGTTVRIALPRR